MLASRANRKLILRTIVSVLIPIVYIIKAKSFDVKKFFVYIIPLALVVDSIAMILVKDSIIGGSAGLLILILNTLIIYFLGMYMIVGLAAFGTRISKKIIKFKETRWQEMLINFGLGLGIFLLIIYLFAMVHLIRGIVIWILFLGLGYMVRYMKSDMLPYKEIISEIAHEFRSDKLRVNRWKWIGIVLLAISLIYYFYGFQLSYIPYSTARDANHAYMYIPKVLAENHGVMRGDV